MSSTAYLTDQSPTPTALPNQDLLIHGKRVPAASGKYFETLNPATEQVIAHVAEADHADVDAAVQSSRAAFETWSQMRAADAACYAASGEQPSGPIAILTRRRRKHPRR